MQPIGMGVLRLMGLARGVEPSVQPASYESNEESR
jgi:hypothetical protein